MPRLPSGLQIAVKRLDDVEILDKFKAMHPEENALTIGGSLAASADSIDSIKPFIGIMFFREIDDDTSPGMDERSEPLPKGIEPYDSGYTLADLAEFSASWPEEDKEAFKAFMESERAHAYLREVLESVRAIGTQYQSNVFDMLRKAGESWDDDAVVNEWDDYDLIAAIIVFTNLPQPEEANMLDLWYRMNAILSYSVEYVRGSSPIGSIVPDSFPAFAERLRKIGNLDTLTKERRKWAHAQNVIFANDLYNLYAPEVLRDNGGTEAYAVVKAAALSEPTR